MIKNCIRNYIYYAELANKVVSIKRILNENIFEIGVGNLIDPSKLPKDIIAQVLEADYLNKKKNKMYLNNLTQKPVPDSFDIYNLLKNYLKEIEFFTFHNEEVIKNVSKLHKYLKMNSTNYSNKCYIELIPPVEITEINMNLEIIKKDQILVYYNLNNNEVVNPNFSFPESK